MALATFAKKAVGTLGLRCGAPALLGDSSSSLRALALRSYSTVIDGLRYSVEHEWVKVDGDTAVVGITDFAQTELGDLIHAELPEVGSSIVQGEQFGVVESVKAASDVIAPVDGEVLEINGSLSDDASAINSDPYGAGWMVKVKLTKPGQLDGLMDAEAYKKHCS